MQKKDFKEAIKENLPVIDEVLAKLQIGLRDRPFRASILFISKCIVEISGDSKDKFLTKPWFKTLRQPGEW